MTEAGGLDPGSGTPLLCYVLPVCWTADEDLAEITAYLRTLGAHADLLIVDGSPAAAFARHHLAWSALGRHLSPDPGLRYLNGKVNGVITGVRHARAERIVIADDDVRYDGATLAQLVGLLDDADLVVPQNYFEPLSWHAAWDSARSLINRSAGMDYPGTLAVRRRRPRLLGLAALAAVGLAEIGRRRNDGRRAFPIRCSWLAPAWLAERSVASWLAAWARLRGGIGYAGRRLRRSANSPAALRRRAAACTRPGGLVSTAGRLETDQRMRSVAERLAR